MRMTLQLDEDVLARLKRDARREGRPLSQLANEILRLGLLAERDSDPPRHFIVEARDLGKLRSGVSFDSVASLIEQIDGPLHR